MKRIDSNNKMHTKKPKRIHRPKLHLSPSLPIIVFPYKCWYTSPCDKQFPNILHLRFSLLHCIRFFASMSAPLVLTGRLTHTQTFTTMFGDMYFLSLSVYLCKKEIGLYYLIIIIINKTMKRKSLVNTIIRFYNKKSICFLSSSFSFPSNYVRVIYYLLGVWNCLLF